MRERRVASRDGRNRTRRDPCVEKLGQQLRDGGSLQLTVGEQLPQHIHMLREISVAHGGIRPNSRRDRLLVDNVAVSVNEQDQQLRQAVR